MWATATSSCMSSPRGYLLADMTALGLSLQLGCSCCGDACKRLTLLSTRFCQHLLRHESSLVLLHETAARLQL